MIRAAMQKPAIIRFCFICCHHMVDLSLVEDCLNERERSASPSALGLGLTVCYSAVQCGWGWG